MRRTEEKKGEKGRFPNLEIPLPINKIIPDNTSEANSKRKIVSGASDFFPRSRKDSIFPGQKEKELREKDVGGGGRWSLERSPDLTQPSYRNEG